MSSQPTPSSGHTWKFFRRGGLDQVSLQSSADLLALGELDPKLWVALSCPARGMEIDVRTLALIDTDGDGRIRIPELLAAVRWAADRLKDAGDLLKGEAVLPLAAIDSAKPEGRALLASIQQLLASLGCSDATTLSPDDTTAAAAAIWAKRGTDPAIAVLVENTGAALAAINAVRAKVDDYFARCRLAAYDPRSLPALNRSEADFVALAAKDLAADVAEARGMPLAAIEPERPLPLRDGVNPAWAAALSVLQTQAVDPVLGARVTALTANDWATLTGKFSAYEAWLAAKSDASASADAERLARYYRDLRTLLHNFVNFADFYSPDRPAVFQAGTLYLDSRSCELCIRVEDPAAHAAYAVNSKLCLVYAECHRPGSPAMKIAAAFTQGDSDYLFVGRNGVFYDRAGRDWDATVTKFIENPISLRQAFFSPYKKVARFVEGQFTKFAAAKDKSSTDNLTQGVAAAAPHAAAPAPPSANSSAFDIAKFAGIFAAVGLALGYLGGAIASVATGFIRLQPWQMPIAVFGALLLISGPSVLLAALKLRQRNLGPMLEASGWAVNGRVKINRPLGNALTDLAVLPPNSVRQLHDPYADNASARRRILFIVAVILIAAALYFAHARGTWPFGEW